MSARWRAILHDADEPVAPPENPLRIESFLRPVEGTTDEVVLDVSSALAALRAWQLERVPGQGDLERPTGFDHDAAQDRLDRLTTLLSEAFGHPCDPGHAQDSACFGSVAVPGEATRTHQNRTRKHPYLQVSVSRFGRLATYASRSRQHPAPAVHPDDRQRIEQAIADAGYVHVPDHVLYSPYDGPNTWALEPTATWYSRFFDYL